MFSTETVDLLLSWYQQSPSFVTLQPTRAGIALSSFMPPGGDGHWWWTQVFFSRGTTSAETVP